MAQKIDVKDFILSQPDQKLETLRRWETELGKRLDFGERCRLMGWQLEHQRQYTGGILYTSDKLNRFRLTTDDGRVLDNMSVRMIHRLIDVGLRAANLSPQAP
jgi:hypothetical protein